MKNVTRHTGTLQILERLPSSLNGNPRFKCLLVEGPKQGIVFLTAPDSSYGYSIQNYEGKKLTVTIGTHYRKNTLNSIED